MKPNPRRLDLTIYPYRFELATRSNDVDLQRHLNNVRLMEFYQEGRVLFYRALRDEFQLERVHGLRTLVVHQAVDFLGEVKYPGLVTLAIGVLHVGNTSYTLGLALFQEGRCVGLASTVIVHATQEGAAPLSAQMREVLQKKLLPEDATSVDA
jgi:acyl-CoA thioester hydrolase